MKNKNLTFENFFSEVTLLKNLSREKMTSQSSTYTTTSNSVGYSWLAVDGLYGRDAGSGQCTHTSNTATPSWWMVDLEILFVIYYVTILTRLDYRLF